MSVAAKLAEIAEREAVAAERIERHDEAESWRRVAELCRAEDAADIERQVHFDLWELGR